MTNPFLTLEGVSCVLPDGRTLFSNLDEQFDSRPTGLVGRNGIGKTLLARIMTGLLAPSSGRCVRSGEVYYLRQQVSHAPGSRVADLAGIRGVLEALERIEAGSVSPADFEAVGERWSIRQQLQQALASSGLSHLDITTPVSRLSGGEAMRVALSGAMMANADFLIMDEPSNHLDRPGRRALIEQLRYWAGGLVVISHDRELLETMDRTVELSSLGLHSHGGGYSVYVQGKEQQQQAAIQQLEHSRLERRRQERAMQEQRERQQHRQARGDRHGREANQAKILLGRQKERSESSAGKLQNQQTAAREQLAQNVREAARQIEAEAPIVLHHASALQPSRRLVAELETVTLPFVPAGNRRFDLRLTGDQRVGVVGVNGCGKSTLLKLLAGLIPPAAGSCRLLVEGVYLDQQLINLQAERSALEQLRAVNWRLDEGVLRMRLAQLGLDAQRILLPSSSLSGGERMKAALACLLYADSPTEFLLLDEPNNHLDLPSMQALEDMLRGYGGALVVASHDEIFLGRLGLTHRLEASEGEWNLRAW